MAEFTRFRDPSTGRFVSAAAAAAAGLRASVETFAPGLGRIAQSVFEPAASLAPGPEAPPEIDREPPDVDVVETARSTQWTSNGYESAADFTLLDTPSGARQFRIVHQTAHNDQYKKGVRTAGWFGMGEWEDVLSSWGEQGDILRIDFDTH